MGKLIRFLAAQDVRTPSNYLESIERWEKTLPELLQNALEKSIKEIEESIEKGKAVKRVDDVASPFKKALKVNIVSDPTSKTGGGFIEAKVVAGRALWIESQRFLLQKTANALLYHKWSIVKPANGLEWFTSDHPVVRLNYYKEGSYDLRGGWGKPGGNLLMPLSPHHLLFTQIGTDLPDKFSFSREKTQEIQKILAERAFRWIFAKQPIKIVERYRPRHINNELFKSEKEQLKRWHDEQSSAERED